MLEYFLQQWKKLELSKTHQRPPFCFLHVSFFLEPLQRKLNYMWAPFQFQHSLPQQDRIDTEGRRNFEEAHPARVRGQLRHVCSAHMRRHFVSFFFLISRFLCLCLLACDRPCARWCELEKRQDRLLCRVVCMRGLEFFTIIAKRIKLCLGSSWLVDSVPPGSCLEPPANVTLLKPLRWGAIDDFEKDVNGPRSCSFAGTVDLKGVCMS